MSQWSANASGAFYVPCHGGQHPQVIVDTRGDQDRHPQTVLILVEVYSATEDTYNIRWASAMELWQPCTLQQALQQVKTHWPGELGNPWVFVDHETTPWDPKRPASPIGQGATIKIFAETNKEEETKSAATCSGESQPSEQETHITHIPDARGDKHVMHLDKMIPRGSAELARINLQPVRQLWQCISTMRLPGTIALQPQEAWQEAARQAFTTTPRWDWMRGCPDYFAFYADGSAIRHPLSKASAATGLLGYKGGEEYYIGCWTILLDENSTSNEAEKAAILLAALLAHKTNIIWQKANHYEFYYDSQVAGNTAAGKWAIKEDDVVTQMTRSLIHALPRCPDKAATKWSHVPGHTGHPWNELADIAAKETRQAKHATKTLLEVIDPLVVDIDPAGTAIQWLWLWREQQESYQQGTRLINDIIEIFVGAERTNTFEPGQHLRATTTANEGREQVKIRLATANVLTLYDHDIHSG